MRVSRCNPCVDEDILAAYDGEELEFNGNDELTILQYVRQHWQDLIDMYATDEKRSQCLTA